jgi:cytochrome c-type biogenesis protein CcmH
MTTERQGRARHGLAAALSLAGALWAHGCGPSREATPSAAPASAAPAVTLPPIGSASPASPPALPPGHPVVGEGSVAPGESIAGTVEIAPSLRAPETGVLFVVARQAGGRQIVAVRKEENPRFPHTFELSARDSMTGDVPFSGMLDLTARLSRTGDAIPAPGDLEGQVANVPVGRRGVKIVIEHARP